MKHDQVTVATVHKYPDLPKPETPLMFLPQFDNDFFSHNEDDLVNT